MIILWQLSPADKNFWVPGTIIPDIWSTHQQFPVLSHCVVLYLPGKYFSKICNRKKSNQQYCNHNRVFSNCGEHDQNQVLGLQKISSNNLKVSNFSTAKLSNF